MKIDQTQDFLAVLVCIISVLLVLISIQEGKLDLGWLNTMFWTLLYIGKDK